jgi:hypothetical protein
MSNNQTPNMSSEFLEKILICLADTSNMVRVLQDFVQNVHNNLNNFMNPSGMPNYRIPL